MSNSKLVNYKKLSPNHSGKRTHKIDRITIHYMAGNLSVESCGNVFAPASRQASSNYGVDSKGRIGLYVDECNRAWTSSSNANDQRAVTIEVANINAKGEITTAAFNALVNLCTDICKRNGIKKLVWRNDKNNPGNMTVHRWFAATSCPGEWFMETGLKKVADAVNKKLAPAAKPTETKPATSTKPTTSAAFKSYKVKVTCDVLNVRKGAGTSYGIATTVKKNEVYTIVGEKKANGYTFGKLKSGAGWIALAYTKKL